VVNRKVGWRMPKKNAPVSDLIGIPMHGNRQLVALSRTIAQHYHAPR
jgi:hypothetical protein